MILARRLDDRSVLEKKLAEGQQQGLVIGSRAEANMPSRPQAGIGRTVTRRCRLSCSGSEVSAGSLASASGICGSVCLLLAGVVGAQGELTVSLLGIFYKNSQLFKKCSTIEFMVGV